MNNFNNEAARRHGVRAAGLLMAMVLTACGGGGGNPGVTTGSSGSGGTGTNGGTGTGTTATAAPTVTLGFTNAAGASSNALTGATPLTVKATVLDANKKPVPNAIVTFATDNTLAVFSPTAGTALTDASGVATISMRAASLSAGGAGTVTATSSVAGTTATGSANYSVGATTLAFGTLTASPASIQAYGSTLLSVDVLNGSSKYTDQQVNVSFSSACVTAGKATLAATVPTNNGTVQTVYRDKGCGNNDIVTVSAAGVAKSASTTLTIAPPAAASVQFVAASPTSQSIVIQGQGGNGRTETATLTFKVVDIFGNPLAGQQVNFSTTAPSITINKASDTTDATGQVVTTVNSGTVPTSFRVQATLPGTGTNGGADISTLSDSIVVTTGLPVQRAFSLSSGSFNVEGWTLDNPSATNVQVMLADAFGNPVPDGTPVVFQTNMGAIGSADKGGCNTVNGVCSVAFRTQAPRTATPGSPATPCNAVAPDATRPGLATVCASSTDGTNTVYARTAIFFSGSAVKNVYMDGSATPLDPTKTVDLGAISGSATKVFTLQLNDVNNNPMPAGSKVEITSMLNGTAAPVMPGTVPNVAPHSTGNVDDPTGMTVGSGPQGSTHVFSISSANPTQCAPAQASFNVTVTSPSGLTTIIPFKLSFTCP
ncbi:Ig-like domain-containing protein [Massilia rhizosphaerae]|uniref:Ig-like domain-containing protein n=1 Tax=Massilia rhizosphaerae TaxID=2784389 RepID=UPI0018DDF664|nr:Ig-like domain-containing protein [Massilia rhizosphaerae]